MSMQSSVWPTEIRLNKEKDTLTVSFDDESTFALSAEYLRVHSPSAEVQGHSPDQRVTVGGKKNVRISSLEQTGNYALKIQFDDSHNTGLYSWGYLHELGAEKDARWAQYLAELEEKGMTRT